MTVIRNFSTGYHAVNGGGDAIVNGWRPSADRPAGAARAGVGGCFVKRPISIYLGVLMILLRTVTTIVTAVNVALDWKQVDISLDAGTSADMNALSGALFVALMIFFGVAVIIDLSVAALIFRGSNRARFVAMILATVFVLGSAADFFADGTSFTLENGGLLGLSLDILVLVALSDSDARTSRPATPTRVATPGAAGDYCGSGRPDVRGFATRPPRGRGARA